MLEIPLMNYKLCLYLPFILFYVNSFTQNNQVLYDFDQLPQTLLLNPGAEVDYDKHLGVPFLSNVYFEIGASNKDITYNNIIAPSDSAEDVLRNVYNQNLSNNDVFLINQRMEFLSAGLRLKNPKYYLSFGMYQETEGFANYPVDLANLYFKGDDQNDDGVPEYGNPFSFAPLNFVGELVGVYHIGISKTINENLTIGARVKLLSGSLNLSTKNNSGEYDLSSSIFGNHHNFNDMNLIINSSGLINPEGTERIATSSTAFKGLFFAGGNFGLGFDLGLTYHVSEKVTVTGSIRDLDFINYSNEVVTYQFNEDFILDDDTYFDPTEGDELNYWEDKFNEDYNNGLIPIDTIQTSYNIGRSPKLNGSVKYKLRDRRKSRSSSGNSAFRNVACDAGNTGDVLSSEVGIQLYANIKPNSTLWAITTFYSRELSKSVNAKVTYTYDEFSAKNIGLGISAHIKDFNIYATADNLLALPKLKDSNYQSFQFGMNFIFN